MKNMIMIPLALLLFLGCTKEPVPKESVEKTTLSTGEKKVVCVLPSKPSNEVFEIIPKETNNEKVEENLSKSLAKPLFKTLPKTHLLKNDFTDLPNWHKEDYEDALNNFVNSCKTKKTKKMYKRTCKRALKARDAKAFIQKEFLPYKINTKNGEEKGLLTGYFEPELRGSLVKTKKYKYPIYETPEDLIVVDLSSIYPSLKNYRLRGKIQGNKLIPYDTRKQSASKHVPAKVICYTDSKIDLFFLEIQGSGRVRLDDGTLMYIGYDNQNGHRYRAIGKYLVKIGALKLRDVSLQTIRAWLDANPKRVSEVLNYNKSVVYFKERERPATGSLGVCLTASRSIAVDRRYIPLGSMLYMDTSIDNEPVSKIVLAQDTGGAIKGAIRADMFLGCGHEARNTAGELKSALELWILLPRNKRVNI